MIDCTNLSTCRYNCLIYSLICLVVLLMADYISHCLYIFDYISHCLYIFHSYITTAF